MSREKSNYDLLLELNLNLGENKNIFEFKFFDVLEYFETKFLFTSFLNIFLLLIKLNNEIIDFSKKN